MSVIDKLKNNSGVISFDTTVSDRVPQKVKAGDSLNIDMVAGKEDNIEVEPKSEPVEISMGDLRKGRHQIVNPRPREEKPSARAMVNAAAVGKPMPKDVDIHVSPEHDMLNLDDPDSIFSRYVKNKDEEAAEWIAQREDERFVMQNADEFEKEEFLQEAAKEENYDIDMNSVVEEDYTMTTVDTSNMNIEVEDLSGLIGEEEDEEVSKYYEEDKMWDDPEYETSEDVEEEYYEEDKIWEEPVTEAAVEEPVEEEIELEDNYTVTNDDVTVEEDATAEIVEEDDSAIETSQEDILKHLQALATEKLKPVSKKLNINSFTVLKKPVSNVAPLVKESSSRIAKWVLPNQKSAVLMKEFTGAELEKLREYSENSRSLDALNRRFNMIYSHIMSPKPANFDTWLKSTPFDDVDSYFFSIYVASFKGANYLPADCINPQCKETFLSDDVDIMSMVEFEDDNAKKKFVELYQSEATPAGKGIFCTEIVPMNERIAISFRQPSIHNVFEIAAMDDKTRAEFSSIVDYIPYIDQIYSIDIENQTLTPIGYKMFADSTQKTIRSKVYKYNQLLSTLSVDEFAIIKAYVKAIAEKTSGISYVYPEIECPKCHNTTEKQRTTAEELVFTRYQLGSLVNTSLS